MVHYRRVTGGGRQLDGGQPAQHGAVLVHTDAAGATQEWRY